jgi:hypothetical protein
LLRDFFFFVNLFLLGVRASSTGSGGNTLGFDIEPEINKNDGFTMKSPYNNHSHGHKFVAIVARVLFINAKK